MEGPPSPEFSNLTNLRQEALRRLSQPSTNRQAAPSADRSDAQRLLHELQVHQLELEMQNEELMSARQTQEASYHRYIRYHRAGHYWAGAYRTDSLQHQ
jgi:hypothetical protein